MPDQPKKPELNNEHRYLALLALTSQELPEKAAGGDGDKSNTEEANAMKAAEEKLFQRLDTDPAELESFLKRERAKSAAVVPSRSPQSSDAVSFGDRIRNGLAALFATATIRYAAAIGVVGIASLLWVAPLLRGDRLTEVVEQSYSNITLAPSQELVLPWEQPVTSVGFAPIGASDSESALAFADGLVRGRQKLNEAAANEMFAGADSVYAALGEWNVLLWAASESANRPAAEFWQGQAKVGAKFAAAKFERDGGQDRAEVARESAEVIRAHVARVNEFIEAIANEQTPARNARNLADELLMFRERFAPHDPARIAERLNGRPLKDKP